MLLPVALGFLSAGCSSSQMKGTPFFTGEYSVRQGPAEDRVNLWPLLYYRDPVLSVLWPLIELTDDHFALRPVVSVYGLDDERGKVVSVLWPLSRFDRRHGENWVFPVFWGKDYTAVFPLYWHFDDPFGEDGGYDGLLPLWSYRTDVRGYSTHVLWPIFHFKDRGDQKGWRVWPLMGSYRDAQSLYRFGLWPLGHWWRRGDTTGGHALLPLYCSQRDESGEIFLSLPYSRRKRADGSGWQLALPLFYKADSEEYSYIISPLYAGGHSELVEDRWSILVPFFFRSRSDDRSLFISIPWLSGRAGGGRQWQCAPPLFFRVRDGADEMLLTPLFARGVTQDTAGDGLAARSAVGPAGMPVPRESLRRWHAVLPLYYYRESGKGRLLATLAGGFETDENGRRWLIYPLLSGGRRGKDGGEIWALAPLCHAEWDAEGAAHHVLPLYYWDSRARTFVSPLAARWRDGNDAMMTLVPPLLSLLKAQEQRRDLWFLGGLGRASWGRKPGPRYLVPLFYSNSGTETLVSPLWARWEANGVDYRAVPVLLSGYATDGQSKDIVVLLGLFHNRSSPISSDRRGHLVPLYYHAGGKTLLTPLFGWDREPENGFVYPVTPLAGWRTGDSYSGGWLFPLFSHKRSKKDDHVDGTFLWGKYWKQDRKGGSGIFPLYSYRNDGPLDSQPGEKVRYAIYGKQATFLPACWYRNQVRVRPAHRQGTGKQEGARKTRILKHGCFPVWSYSRTEALDKVRKRSYGSILLGLYDYKRTVTARDPDDGEVDDYTRTRILWRLWHYERVNGDVSADVFPAITYDRKKDGFKKISFLWRLFRYERGEDGRKLDLLFMPIIRPNLHESISVH